MKINIIIQIIIAMIFAGGIFGLVKLKGLQKIIAIIVMAILIVVSLLVWFG